jgi:hypothetical protein
VGLVDVDAALVDGYGYGRPFGGVGNQEQQQLAIISHLGRGDAADAMRVKDEQHAGVSLPPVRGPRATSLIVGLACDGGSTV